MDVVVESIVSAGLGPKWAALFTRLNLVPRDRYQIETMHKDKAPDERYACCIRDTVTRWRRTVVPSVDESEAARQLLCALERVQSFEVTAREIAEANGIVLHPTTSSEEESDAPRSKLSDPKHLLEKNLATKRSQWPSLSKAVVVSVNHADILNKQHTAVIDLSIGVHKYAILDICQKMRGDLWEQFASALTVPSTTVSKLEAEEEVEERYYQTIKDWLNGTKPHTFNELQELLDRFNCSEAISVLQKRLDSSG